MVKTDAAIYLWIEGYFRQNKRGPSFRDVERFCGYRSKNGAAKRLRKMQARKLVDWHPRKARSLRVLRHRYFMMNGGELTEVGPCSKA